MAMTATISVNPTDARVNQKINAILTVSNSGSSDVDITSANLTAIYTGASVPNPPGANLGVFSFGPGEIVTIAASGSLALNAGLVFFAPSTLPDDSGSGTFDIGALVQTSDGSIFSPTAATATVHPVPQPSQP